MRRIPDIFTVMLSICGVFDANRCRPPQSPRGARRAALLGVARVSYDGKTVEYRSLAEIDRAIEALDREIAAAEGRPLVRQVRVVATKGL